MYKIKQGHSDYSDHYDVMDASSQTSYNRHYDTGIGIDINDF